MGKIMGNLKHTYNAFPELQTKFFHTQCVIWSFPPSFTEFHHNFHILEISGIVKNCSLHVFKHEFTASTWWFQWAVFTISMVFTLDRPQCITIQDGVGIDK